MYVRVDPNAELVEGEFLHPGLMPLYEAMLQSKPMPKTLVLKSTKTLDDLFGIFLYTNPGSIYCAKTAAVITQVDLVHRYGLSAMAHIDNDLKLLLRFAGAHLTPDLSGEALAQSLSRFMSIVLDYVGLGKLPDIKEPLLHCNIEDTGSDGFVYADSKNQDFTDVWLRLYEIGYTKGIVIGRPDANGKRQVMIAKKSEFVTMDLALAKDLLNDVERALGNSSNLWELQGNFLIHTGTDILPKDILEVLIRV